MPKIILNDKNKKQIAAAVKKAESKTSGEIVTAFIKESHDYAVHEMSFAVIVSFIYFVAMMFFVSDVQAWLQGMFWDYTQNYLIAFYGFSVFLVGAIFYFLANVAAIDRLIVPKKVMQQKVHDRALLHYMESGIYNTRDHTGILIFISLLEHRVELLADKGISVKIPLEHWQQMVEQILTGVKQGDFVNKLCLSVEECGTLLAEHFPIKADDSNELTNDINVLEK